MQSGRGQKGADHPQEHYNQHSQPQSQRGSRSNNRGRGRGNQGYNQNQSSGNYYNEGQRGYYNDGYDQNDNTTSKDSWEMPSQSQKRGGWNEYKGKAAPTDNYQGGKQPSNYQKSTKKGNNASEQKKEPNAPSEEQKSASNGDSAGQQFQYKEHKTLSSLKLVALSNEGPQVYTFNAHTNGTPEDLVQEEGYPAYPGAEIAKFSPTSGQTIAVIDFSGIHLIDVDSKKERLFIEKKGIISMEWSPLDTYVVTCEKLKLNEKNLQIWDAATGECVQDFEYRNAPKLGAKSIKFDVDEKFSARQIGNNMIEIYESSNFKEPKFQIKSKLPPLPKVDGQVQEDNREDNSHFDGFLFCPASPDTKGPSNPSYFMAWQNGEVLSESDDNGLVYVYDLNSALQRPKFNIACPRAQNIQVLPAPTGHAILVWSQNLNDSTGKSYYGEHSLQYVRIHKGKNRHFIPVFDDQIQDVTWTPDGSEFIVVSGQQPATATMYDSDGQPKFEFGKKFRNTLKICPFGNSLMVGGFGNITKGEMDFWNIENLKEIGVTVAKAPCATQISWSACGRYILTSVLYERLKVDNGFNIHRANGTRALTKAGKSFSMLHHVEWQPRNSSELSKPNIDKLRRDEQQEANAKPKKFFRFGKGANGGGSDNGAFQQMMRQNMASSSGQSSGPKRVDASQYKELQEQQTAKAQQIIQSQATTSASSQAPSTKMNEASSGAGASQSANQQNRNQKANVGAKASGPTPSWRTGNFHDDTEYNQYGEEVDQTYAQQQSSLANQMHVEEVKISKHAARRQKKKNKGGGQVIANPDLVNPVEDGPIMGNDEPSLGDL